MKDKLGGPSIWRAAGRLCVLLCLPLPAQAVSLPATLNALPTQAARGESVTVWMTVNNNLGVQVNGVTAQLQFEATSASAAILGGPLPSGGTSIPAGGQVSFTWVITPRGTGKIFLAATAVGADASGNPVAATASLEVSGVYSILYYGPVLASVGAPELDVPYSRKTTWSDIQWAAATTADFSGFDAIVIGDNANLVSAYNPAIANNYVWASALTGNMIILGCNTYPHLYNQDVRDLITRGIVFAADDPAPGPGLYLCLGGGYGTYVDGLLAGLGQFTYITNPQETVHKLVSHPVLAGLTDASLSYWYTSSHISFLSYPSYIMPMAMVVDPTGNYHADGGYVGYPTMLASGPELLQSWGVPRLAKRMSPAGAVYVGSTVTYTVSWENVGAQTLHGLVITDALPEGLLYLAPGFSAISGPGGGAITASAWSSSVSGPWIPGEPPNLQAAPLVLRWVVDEVSVSATGEVSFQVMVGGGISGGKFANRATATISEDPNTYASNTVEGTVNPGIPAAVSCSSTVLLGGWFTVVVTVTNTGFTSLENVVPSLEISPGFGSVYLVSGPVPTSTTGLALGESASFTWTFSASGAGVIGMSFLASALFPGDGTTVYAYGSGTMRVLRPASLAASLAAVPADACLGEDFLVLAEVTNMGDAPASGVVPDILRKDGTGSVTETGGPWPPGPLSLAGGQTIVFTWTLNATGLGPVPFSTTIHGVDSIGGMPVDVACANPGFAVTDPPTMDVSIAAPRRVSRGHPFFLTLTATNTGEGSIASVVPSLAIGPGAGLVSTIYGPIPSASASLAPASRVIFLWSISATGSGLVAFTGTVSGLGCESLPLAAFASVSTTVDEPARLAGSLVAYPGQVNEGGAFMLTLTVSNTGGADAEQVKPALPLFSGSGLAALTAGPSPSGTVSIPGGGMAVFTWTLTGVSWGVVAASVNASGKDGNSLAGVQTGIATSNFVQIFRPAHLGVSVSGIPSSACLGHPILVTVTVTNTGQNAAGSFALADPLPSGGGGATPVAGPNPAVPVDLAAGAAVTFSWTFTAGPVGPVTFTATATGVDARDSSAVSSGPVNSSPVDVAPAGYPLAALSAPAKASVGQWVSLVLTVTNYGGTTLSGVAPVLAVGPGAGTLKAGPIPAGPVSLPAGASTAFSWTLSVSGASVASFTGTVTGTVCGDTPVEASGTASMLGEMPVLLRGAVAVEGGELVVGRWVSVTLTVTNAGEATALSIVPLMTAVGAPTALISGPVPGSMASLAAGAAVTFTWTFSISGTGNLSFSGQASAVDANSGLAKAGSASSGGGVPVHQPAILASGGLALSPIAEPFGGSFAGRLVLRNTGGAALSVLSATLYVDGNKVGGLGPPSSPTPSLPAVVAAGGSLELAWIHSAAAPCGTALVAAAVCGEEAVTGRRLPELSLRSNLVGVFGAPAGLSLSAEPSTEHVGERVTLVAHLTDSCGVGVAGESLPFSVLSGGGSLDASAAVTDVTGRARVGMKLGPDPVPNVAKVVLAAALLSATATVTALPDPLSIAEAGAAGLSLNEFSPRQGEVVLARFHPANDKDFTARIYTASGRLVRTLARGAPIGGGQWVAEWDGRTEEGFIVARGVYIVRILGGGMDEKLKVVVK